MGDDPRMEFWSTIGSLLRRKWVIIPALVVALTLGVVAYLGTPPTYTSSTTMILSTTQYGDSESLDPSKPSDLTNPLLNFNDSLRTTSAILIQAMTTKDVQDQLDAGVPTQLIVNDGRTNPDLLGLNGPFLYIEATSTSSAAALQTVKDAQAMMRQKLKEWQSSLNAPEKTFVSLVDIVPPNSSQPDHGRGTKLGLMAFIFGFLLCLGIAYFRNQRRARKAARAAANRPPLAAAPPVGEVAQDDRAPRPSAPPIVITEDDEDDTEPDVVATSESEPDVVATSEGDAAPESEPESEPDSEPEAEPEPEPEAAATPVNGSQPAAVTTPFKRPEPRFPTHPQQRKPDPFLRPVPMKQKVRSRNR